MMDPYMVKTKKKVEQTISAINEGTSILIHTASPNENCAMNPKYDINSDTRAVVSKEFCGLKCSNCMMGNMTSMMDVITLTQRVLAQVSVAPLNRI